MLWECRIAELPVAELCIQRMGFQKANTATSISVSVSPFASVAFRFILEAGTVQCQLFTGVRQYIAPYRVDSSSCV